MSALAPRVVREERRTGALPIWTHPEWETRFPWLVQGVTGVGEAEVAFDLGLFGAQPVGEAIGRWRALGEELGLPSVVHSHQVHRAEVAVHRDTMPPGLMVLFGYDAHVTDRAGLLLTASVADCVPVTLVDPRHRRVAIAHAGWRGVAGRILPAGVRTMVDAGSRAGEVWLHCGPAICGECYEVGPEVHRGVRPDQAPPEGPAPIDLRQALVEQGAEEGIDPGKASISAHCTRCASRHFFSHRAGSPARQMSFVGVRRD